MAELTVGDLVTVTPALGAKSSLTVDEIQWLELNFEILKRVLGGGASGSFTTVDGKTVTVIGGVITGVV